MTETGESQLRCTHVLASIADPSAGPSQSVPALCCALNAVGVVAQIETVAGWRAGYARSPDAGAPLQVHERAWAGQRVPGWSSVCASPALRKALIGADPRPDIFHAHGLWLMPNIYPAEASRRLNIPIVHSIRGMLGREALVYSRWKKQLFDFAFQRRALLQAACLHATSTAEYEEIRRYGLPNPVAIIPNGVDLPPARNAALGRNGPIIISLGRIHPKKGLDTLLQAWARVEQAHPNARLRIIGPAELGHDDELRALALALQLRHASIEAPVHGANKWDAYAAADLFVLPSRNENFAMTVAEALASGTPVISTKGAPWAGLETEQCGWWIDHGVDPMAAALLQALELPKEELQAKGVRGRDWMGRDFSWGGVAQKFVEIYAWLARGADRPDCARID